VLGIGDILSRDQQYTAKITIESPYIRSEVLVDLLNELNPYLQEEPGFVAQKLQLQEEVVRQLKKVDAQQVREFEGKSINKTNRINIKIYTSTREMEVVKAIFTGLIASLEQNPYVEKQVSFEQRRILQLQEEIKQKILELEQLQEKSMDQIEITQDIFSYHHPVVQLFDRESELEKELQKAQALVTISNDPYPLKVKPEVFSIVSRYSLWPVFVWIVILLSIAFVKTMDQGTFFQ
jgi:hypothetical protein